LELELARHDIPFVKRGGFKFVETAHVKDVLAHLRIVHNPQDAVSWHRVLLLLEGVGPKTSDEIMRAILAHAEPLVGLRQFPKRDLATDLQALANLIEQVRAADVPELQLELVLTYYDAILQRVYRDDYPKRRRDLDHFAAIAARYRSVEALLVDMALEPPADS